MYNYTDLEDTIIALATPSGEGAIGLLRLSGKEALPLCERFFSKSLLDKTSHTLHYGKIRHENGRLLDEVVVSLYKNPRSYTGQDVVEIACHGSSYILQEVLSLFLRNGARLAQRGEFTLRAFLNGKMDLTQAEAVADLIASDSAASHQLALQQMRGGFSQDLEQLRQRLIKFASLIELELDFGEEDVEFAQREELQALIEELQSKIKTLMDSFQLGNVLKKGVSTVIAGRPNAGKSTLLNALLNEERAIVSDIAGTTRDTIEEVLNIKGVQFRLVDTAGIREAQDKIEAIGVEKTLAQIERAKVVVYLFDAQALGPEEVQADVEKLTVGQARLLVVANKMDLLAKKAPELPFLAKSIPYLSLSAQAKTDLESLRDALYALVIGQKLEFENPILSNSRHYQALQEAYLHLDKVLEGLHIGLSGDLLALDLRHSLRALGELSGSITTDDLLDSIFRDFCIGK